MYCCTSFKVWVYQTNRIAITPQTRMTSIDPDGGCFWSNYFEEGSCNYSPVHHNCANICMEWLISIDSVFLPSCSEMEFQQHETLQNISNKNGIMLFCNQLLITNRPHKGHGSIRKTEKSGQERFPPSSFPLLFSFSSFSSHLLSLTLISSQSTAFVASVAKISKYALWGNNSGSKQAARKPYNWCWPVWVWGVFLLHSCQVWVESLNQGQGRTHINLTKI